MTDAQISDDNLFGTPLFDDPSARAMSRVGVIDVGSNSVRFVVFDGAARSPAYFFNEKIMCGLGEGLRDTGLLNPEGRARALAAMHRFAALRDAMDVKHLTTVATAAVRDAKDGPDFVAQVHKETGIKMWVVNGKEEARLSAQGVLLGWPGYFGLVCDIGGSSMELAEISDGRVGKRITSALGPQILATFDDDPKALKQHIKQTVSDLSDYLGPQSNRLFLVGGSWRAFAKVDMHRRGYPLNVLHEYRMAAGDIEATAGLIANTDDLEDLRDICGVSSTRMGLLPLAVPVLQAVVQRFEPVDIAVSSYGIREGMLYEQMPNKLRDRDPLIEACRYAEKKDARQPGFGRRLYKFVVPLFADADDTLIRMVKAACLLHDVNWRAHPDYRAEVCFDTATRANLGGLRHSERIFLGTALMYRYRNSPEGSRFDQVENLATEQDQHRAEILGKAMRLGAMLWDNDTDQPAQIAWVRGESLTLNLYQDARALNGEVVAARLASLASTLGVEHAIKVH
ncbi:MAG: Ppx/GppA family phosphatase [Planktomarina sp.]